MKLKLGWRNIHIHSNKTSLMPCTVPREETAVNNSMVNFSPGIQGWIQIQVCKQGQVPKAKKKHNNLTRIITDNMHKSIFLLLYLSVGQSHMTSETTVKQSTSVKTLTQMKAKPITQHSKHIKGVRWAGPIREQEAEHTPELQMSAITMCCMITYKMELMQYKFA